MRTLVRLFVDFFKIGAFTLGGGYAMLSLIEQKVVQQRKWLSAEDFTTLTAVVQALPGVIAVNMSLYVGYKIKGVKGSAVACLGIVLPSFVIMLLLAGCFAEFRSNSTVTSIFQGIRPVVVALILAPAVRMLKTVGLTYKSILLSAMALALVVCGVSPIVVVLIAIVVGIAWGVISTKRKLQ